MRRVAPGIYALTGARAARSRLGRRVRIVSLGVLDSGRVDCTVFHPKKGQVCGFG